MSQEVLPDIPVQRYRGPPKPEIQYSVSTKYPLSLRVLARQIMSASRAKKLKIEIGTPEYHLCSQIVMDVSEMKDDSQ